MFKHFSDISGGGKKVPQWLQPANHANPTTLPSLLAPDDVWKWGKLLDDKVAQIE